MLAGRRYSEGLHQAIEAKENVKVQEESMTLATISFQNYFRLYKKLAGMTGTAKTEEEEFQQVYDMDVISIPTNKKVARIDHPDLIYPTELAKFKAIIAKVKELNAKGQPVLIGTVSIEKNEVLSRMLDEANIKHQVLNAKNNESEATVIAMAGQKGSVTLATNIAGRGTDIMLGDGVAQIGGLFVIGSERHESRRIDNQLRGRCGRQGDKGETQFFLSLQDELMRIFAGDKVTGLLQKFQANEDEPMSAKLISRSVESAQKRVEGVNYDNRKNVVQYDDVMNRHRKSVYTTRRNMLVADQPEKIEKLIDNLISDETKRQTKALINLATTNIYEAESLIAKVSEQFNLHPDQKNEIIAALKLPNIQKESQKLKKEHKSKKASKIIKKFKRSKKDNLESSDNQKVIKAKLNSRATKSASKKITTILSNNFKKSQEKLKQTVDSKLMFDAQRGVYLAILDELWMQHLENMDHLRNGIGWKGVGQKDPLVEYRFEGQNIFNALNSRLQEELVAALTHMNPKHATKIETDITRASKNAESNANQILSGQRSMDSDDFIDTSLEFDSDGHLTDDTERKNLKNTQKLNQAKNKAKAKKKSQRKNRKKGR
jgi:preprotein translocase subunit SecA